MVRGHTSHFQCISVKVETIFLNNKFHYFISSLLGGEIPLQVQLYKSKS